MRIIHIIATLDPAAGGPPAVALPLASAQAALGCDVHVLSADEPAGHDSDAARRIDKYIADIPGAAALTVHRIPGAAPPLLPLPDKPAAHLDTLLSDRGETPTVGHIHGIWEPTLPRCAKVMRRRAVPYTLTPHGMLDPWSMQQKALKKKLALALGYRTMLHRAAFLHALNDDEQTGMAPQRLAAPVRVIPNGVFLDQLLPLPEAGLFRRDHPALGDAPFFLFLSRLHYKKGLDILAGAFAEFARSGQPHHLVVAGPDDGAADDFRRAIDAHGLADRAHLVGPIYGDTKRAALRDADAFVLPSRSEGFSIAITEALACALPVVITEACHFPEVAAVGAGRVTPLDAHAFAAAMLDLAADPHAARAMGDAGHNLVEQRFTWPKVADAFITAFREIA